MKTLKLPLRSFMGLRLMDRKLRLKKQEPETRVKDVVVVEEDSVEAADVVDLVVAAEAVNATTATKRGTLQENALRGIDAVTNKQRAQSPNPPPFYEFCQLDIC